MVGYLHPDEDWMTAPWEGENDNLCYPDQPWAWDEDPEPDYEHDYREKKAEADAEWSAWIDM